MKIDLKNNKKHKFIFYGVCILIIIWAFSSMLFDSSDNVTESSTEAVERDIELQNEVNKNVQQVSDNNNQQTAQKTDGGVNVVQTDAGAVILFGENGSNPFVEKGNYNNVAGTVQSQPVAVHSYTAPAALPAIPRPNLPAFQIPQQPGTVAAPPAAVPAKPQVQGILSGGNGGNMAILSDGRIVSEGDTFQDGRIAYIGGDGITMEDGSLIVYK